MAREARQIAPAFKLDGKILPGVKLHKREGFDYTTPSVHPPRSAADRRAYGCEESSKGKFTGRLTDGRPDTFCKSESKPCGDRQTCPVQLVWVKGQSNLRFCVKPGEPGYLVPVATPEEAQALAEKACAAWPNRPKKKVKKGDKEKLVSDWPEDFFTKNAPDVVSMSQRAHPQSPWGIPGLGEDFSCPKKSFYITAGAIGGVAASGLLLLYIIKHR